jgi:tetratricopeptide (TPR) repeat protein
MTLAQLYVQKGMLERGEALLDEAILETRLNADAYNNRGVLKLLKGRPKEALSDFRQASKLRIRTATFHNNLGVCYALLKSRKKSLREFKTALALNPLDEHAVKNFSRVSFADGIVEAPIPFLEKLLSYRTNDCESRELLAKAYFQLGKYTQALEQLSAAFEIAETQGLKKHTTRILNNLGVVRGALGETEKAEQAFKQCLVVDPNSRIASNNLASLFLKEGRLADATLLLNQSITRLGEDAVSLTLFGECFHLGEQYDTAEECYRKAIACDPKYHLAYAFLSRTLIEAFSQHDAAINICQLGLEQKPNEPLLLNNLAYAYLMAGDTRKARSILDRIPDKEYDVFLTATRGLLLLKENDLLEASRLYNTAAAMAKSKELRGLLLQKKNLEFARYAVKQGNEAKASRLLAQVLKIRTNEKIYLHQAAKMRNQIKDQRISID